MAKELRPKSLRAKYGETPVQNAVHCSDLPQEAPLEVRFSVSIANMF